MSETKTKWLVLGCVGVLICCAAVACAFIGLTAWNPLASLPTYEMEQTDSVHEGYRRTTLTSGNSVYVLDFEEYALSAFGALPTQRIGRFPVPGFGGSGLYAIPGQDPSAYVLEYDPMYQAVYRNINHPPFDWYTAEFQMMRLGIPTGPAANKETTDQQIIRDVMRTLMGAEIFIVPLQPNGQYDGYENHTIQLFSDQLPGLAYSAGLHLGPAGQVYLAENAISNQWHPAGSLFLEWMTGP